MPTLLVSLGTSWAVVPEAFHLLPPGPDGFSAVHVLTTASEKIDAGIHEVRTWFGKRHPQVALTITRVKGFTELRSADDHVAFEEVLYRWLLDKAPRPDDRHVCLAGGFKTMSAAMQKAAAVFGAAEVFHVLTDSAVNTADLVDDALKGGRVHFVRLGPEGGWPQLSSDVAGAFPLIWEPSDPTVSVARAPDSGLRSRIREIVERSHRIAGNWSQLPDLPFPEVATFPNSTLSWLRSPVAPHDPPDRAWIRRLPKLDLHTHLGGFASHGDDLARVRAAAAQPGSLPPLQEIPTPPGWPHPPEPCGLEAYLRLGDNTGSALLKDPGCLRAHCEILYDRLVEDNVVYAEIRCSPNNYATEDRSAWDVLADIRGHFQRRMDASATGLSGGGPACHVNLLLIATRRAKSDRSSIARHLALAISASDHWRDPNTCRIVGVDLAGFENPDTRAALFATDFEPVHRVGLAVTVHAGENDDAEAIWQAVFKLNARRLGHALRLRDSPDLLRSVADRGIAVEMCPYANLQIVHYPIDDAASGTGNYPLLDYLNDGLRVTLNTDNLGISAASLSDNFLLAARLCPGLTRLDCLRLVRHAIDAAFVPPSLRRTLAGRVASMLPRP